MFNLRRSVGDKITPMIICVLTHEVAKVNFYPGILYLAVSFHHDLFYIIKKVKILCEALHCTLFIVLIHVQASIYFLYIHVPR